MQRTSGVPLKWQKYLILVEYGLTTTERLAREVRRYPISDRTRLANDIEHDMSADGASKLIVVKLVRPDASGQLPNYRVHSHADLDGLYTFLNDAVRREHTEAWYCPTTISTDVRSLAGRLVFEDGFDGRQVLEQIWRCSPRLIETVTYGHSGDFKWPFMRANRPRWGWRHRIDDLYLPSEWPQEREEVLGEARDGMLMLESAREHLEVFASSLAACGITCFSMEYKIVGSKLWFIDWDTRDDARAIRSFGDLHLL